ncbi:GspE/PulE family protein [Leptothrix ochracea]|uniref:GspE/PulE family protein n=1 Tax=Leptothrix ochracea TaxID=735331 RepID=UPI0034E1B335
MSTTPVPVGRLRWADVLDWLVQDGWIAAVDRPVIHQRLSAGVSSLHPLVRLGSAGLIRVGTQTPLDTDVLLHWLAKRVGLLYLRIDPLKVDVARVTEVMSLAYAEKRRVLPVQVGPTEVTIATCEPFERDWVVEISAHTRKTVRLALAHPHDIARFTTEFYSLARSVRQAQKTGEANSATVNFEQLVEMGRHKQLDANDHGVVQVVDWLWNYAFEQRASDIHLEPRREQCAVRFRIDGVLHTVYHLPQSVMTAATARIKLLARMDVVERRRAQDGRIKTRNPRGDEIEMRLSTLPTAFGEKVVMRIFNPDTAVLPVEALGFSSVDAGRWAELVRRPHGIILVTGPTGSGKTTTLYATLKRLASDEVNVCTLEDPIEMIEPAFNQTQVQPALELDFANGVRALMRQDPDIIMIGEIRDVETAEMAVQAALTGHLVFSTLHTNDAASAITRLTDLGVPTYLIKATVIGVLAQRLVRTLCAACKQPDETMSRERLEALLGASAGAVSVVGTEPARPFQPYRAVGCIDCRMTGYRGRCGLVELLVLDEPMRSLRQAGFDKVAEGLTSAEEILRATPA